MYQNVQALVLRVTEYGEYDGILTLLTPQYGKITAKARGLRRKKSPLIAQCQLLAYAEFTLFEQRGIYVITEATTIDLFHELRRDLTRLSLGTYFAQAAEVLSQEDQPDPELMSLTLNCLYALSRLDIPEGQVKAVFELRSACIAGYYPDLSGCPVCGAEWPDRFDLSEGCLSCKGCGQAGDGIRLPVTTAMVQAMRYIVSCERGRLFSFRLPEKDLTALSALTEAYLITQLERGFSALDFYKSLLV